MLGGIGGRRRGQQRMRRLDGITNSMDVSLSEPPGVDDGQVGLACCNSWGCKESDMTEQLNCLHLNLPECKLGKLYAPLERHLVVVWKWLGDSQEWTMIVLSFFWSGC